MSIEAAFLLEQAGWPAFLVDGTGRILRWSDGALPVFGRLLQPNCTFGKAFWVPENPEGLDGFLAGCRSGEGVPLVAKLKIPAGQTRDFTLIGNALPEDQGQGFIIQCLPPPPKPVSAPVPAPPAVAAAPAAPSGNTTFLSAVASGTAAPGTGGDSGFILKQKLDCALQLTRTVAIDFNNALTSILGHTSLVLSRLEQNSPWRNSLVEIEKSAARAAEVAADLAGFSRVDREAKPLPTGNLNDLARRAVEMFRSPSRPGLGWELTLEQRPYATAYDEAKMQQAFVKMLENAVQATPDGGRIAVMTRNCDFQEVFQDGTVKIPAGGYVCFEVSDTGCGITQEVLPRIFEPFFTTKKNPPHRGLGLAWVYGIATNHGGFVTVSSTVGRGTSVRLYLPTTRRSVRDEEVRLEELVGTETILVVDDEELLLTMMEVVLGAYGYKVISANSGAKALDIVGKSTEPIHLVVTDLVMPQMSGREFVEKLKVIKPAARVLYASGYTRTASGLPEELYIQKPFTSQSLVRKVKAMLTS